MINHVWKSKYTELAWDSASYRFLDFKKIGILFGWFLLGLAFLYLAIILAMLSHLTVLVFGGSPLISMESRGFGIIFAGLVGFPFLVWRSVVAANQSRTAQQSLSNEKFTAAANQLNARRQQSVSDINQEAASTDIWEDDLNARSAAILILESLVEEDPLLAPRVDRLLAGYIRVNFPCDDQMDFSAEKDIGVPRMDLQQALEVIGRIHPVARQVDSGQWRLDLRRCTLNGVDFQSGNYFAADFNGSDVQGANFGNGSFHGSLFTKCNLNFSKFRGASLKGTRFNSAILTHSAFISGSVFDAKNKQGMIISYANLQGLGELSIWKDYSDIIAFVRPEISDKNYHQDTFAKVNETDDEKKARKDKEIKRQIRLGIRHWFVSNGEHHIEPRSVFEKHGMLHWPYWEQD